MKMKTTIKKSKLTARSHLSQGNDLNSILVYFLFGKIELPPKKVGRQAWFITVKESFITIKMDSNSNCSKKGGPGTTTSIIKVSM